MPNSRKNPKVDVGDLKPYIVGDADTAQNATMSEQILIDVFPSSTEMENTNETALQAVEEVIRLEEQQQQGAVSRQLAAAVAVTREQQQQALDKARQPAPPDVGASKQSVAATTSTSSQERPTAWWDDMEVDHEVEVATTRLSGATDRPQPRGPPMTPSPPPLSMKPSAVKSRARRARKNNPNRQWTVDDLESAVSGISLPRGGEGAALSIGSYAMQSTLADPQGPEQCSVAPSGSMEQSSVLAGAPPPPPASSSSVEQSGATASSSQPPPTMSSGEQHNVPATSWDLPMEQSGSEQQDHQSASSTSANSRRPSASASSHQRRNGQATRRANEAASHQHQGVASGRVGKTQKRRDRRRRLEERIAGGYVPPCPAPKKKERREIRHGVFFGELARVAIDDRIDPPNGTCFRCWQPGHRSIDCRSGLDEHFCGNCGRSGRYTADCERCGARLRLMLPRLSLPHAVTRGLTGRGNEEGQDRRQNEPPRAAGCRTEAWAVAVVEEGPSPPARAQGPPAASRQCEPRQQVYPEQYRAPQLSEVEMCRRVMERQAQIEAARAEHQRAVEEAYAIELIRARAFARTGPYHQWQGPPRDQR
uniref:CCHC-type domain-containing protein n=1 Tax=Trichogramma kaykai TaxID=54128 RepID=A0ABD2VZM7_9HYME